MTNEHRVSYNRGCKSVLGKGSCCIYQMACLPYATFSYGECTTFSQQLRKEKRQQCKPWEKLSLLLANIKQHLGTHRLWSNVLGTLELPNLWSLSLQSRELRFSGMSFQPIEVPHNTGKRVARNTRLPNPSCWCCSRASIPPYNIAVPGKHPPATLQRCQPGALSPRFHSGGGEPRGVTEALVPECPKCPSIPLHENLGRSWYRDKGNSAGMHKEFYLALINQEFLTMPYLSGKLLTISNALKVSK